MTQRQNEGPNLDRLHVLDNHGRRQYIYPADVSGFFSNARPFVFGFLIAIYLGLPWLKIGGNPAVLIDIAKRNFYLFGQVYNAQDVYLMFFLASGAAFALVFLTAVLGRVWCGWLCPQTVFIEGVFRRLERWIEGPAYARVLLRKAPWNASKIARKLLKHVLYIGMCLALAHVFLAYFNAASVWFLFWPLSAILYFNFFWFREQFCIVMCPYGRLQSALQDNDTININYDAKRGEPRGKAKLSGLGDCVDCGRCVAVCPTGIDIRNGLQMECIGCANCVDACDAIMSKLNRPLGLIRYDSLRGLETGKRRYLRPRLIAYCIAGLIGLSVGTVLWMRHLPFEANLLRVQGIPFTIQDGVIRNQFMVHFVNKNQSPSVLTIVNQSDRGVEVMLPVSSVTLKPLESFQSPVVFLVKRSDYVRDMKAKLLIEDSVSGKKQLLVGTIIGPF